MGLINATCKFCDHKSCLQCCFNAHRPLSCKKYRYWTELISDVRKSELWMKNLNAK